MSEKDKPKGEKLRDLGFKPVLFFDVPSTNGRTYTKESVAKALDEVKARIDNRKMYGEVGHPVPGGTTATSESALVSLSRVSHSITYVKVTDEALLARIEILDTDGGDTIRSWYMRGIEPVFRPRMLGEVGSDGNVHVTSIVSFDAIPPSEDGFIEAQRLYDGNNPEESAEQ